MAVKVTSKAKPEYTAPLNMIEKQVLNNIETYIKDNNVFGLKQYLPTQDIDTISTIMVYLFSNHNSAIEVTEDMAQIKENIQSALDSVQDAASEIDRAEKELSRALELV